MTQPAADVRASGVPRGKRPRQQDIRATLNRLLRRPEIVELIGLFLQQIEPLLRRLGGRCSNRAGALPPSVIHSALRRPPGSRSTTTRTLSAIPASARCTLAPILSARGRSFGPELCRPVARAVAEPHPGARWGTSAPRPMRAAESHPVPTLLGVLTQRRQSELPMKRSRLLDAPRSWSLAPRGDWSSRTHFGPERRRQRRRE